MNQLNLTTITDMFSILRQEKTRVRVTVVAVESLKTCNWSITWIPSARMWRPYSFAALELAIAPMFLLPSKDTACSQCPNHC